MTDPNVAILNGAWALLWKQGSPYYLPTVLANGGTFGGTHIPPMSDVAVSGIGTIPLYSSDTWGNVSITLTSPMLAGLPSVGPDSFKPSSDATSVTATVKFNALTFSGGYEVDGTGLAGCAMDIAEVAASATPPPGNMDLARSYRDQLVRSPNGTQLVGKYYDHNDTINLLLGRNNAFTRKWPNGVTPSSPDTATYMQQTAQAAANPDNPDYTIGGDDTGYHTHAIYMQSMLVATCQYYQTNDPENAAAFGALADDAATFKAHTDQQHNPMTVGQVMTTVANTAQMTPEQVAAAPEPEASRAARLAAERDFPELQRAALAEEAARAEQAVTYKSTGNFGFGFAMPTLTFSGTVAVSGTPPNYLLTVTLTSLVAAIPSVQITLLSGTDPRFTAEAQSKINDAQWFQRVLGTNVNAKLGSSQVLSYLSSMINQAIASIMNG